MKTLKSSFLPAAKVALISIQPRYADRIVAGEKRLEFRRRWTSSPVDVLVVYSSSPVQRLVIAAKIMRVVEASPTALWNLARERGGGVTRSELYSYLRGLTTGFAIELGKVFKFRDELDPRLLFGRFTPPQSFRYLAPDEYGRIAAAYASA